MNTEASTTATSVVSTAATEHKRPHHAPRNGIRWVLLRLFFAVSFLPAALIGIISFEYSRVDTLHAVLDEMLEVNHLKQNLIITYLEEQVFKASVLADSPAVSELAGTIGSMVQQGLMPSVIQSDSTYKDTIERTTAIFTQDMLTYGFTGATLVSGGQATILYSTDATRFPLGMRLAQAGPGRFLYDAWTEVRQSGSPVISEVRSDASGATGLLVAVPITSATGVARDVLVLDLALSAIDQLASYKFNDYKTRESYLIDESQVIVTSPQFPVGDKRLGSVYRPPHVLLAMEQESYAEVVRKPPEGNSIVFSASRFASDAVRTARVLFDWTLVTQMDYRELTVPTMHKGLVSLGFSLGITLLIVSVGLIVVRRMTNPILALDTEVSRLAQGYLDYTSTSTRQDEIGSLERNAGEMVAKLREIVTLIDETVTTTTSIGTTISTSVEQQSAISVEQAGSIAEISSTMDEFTSSFSQVSENVSSVADMVQHILKYVTESSRLIHAVAEKIKDINNDNDRDIAHIMELKKRSKEIAKVMEIINNISDQTKIIAFNAALEASSAGEAGKRFGVVAAEIRNLTENVIQSTSSIDGIVGEIQTLADQMVMASEKTTKNITEGLAYSSESVENMESIVQSISASNDAVKQIVLSVQQQKSATAQIQLGLKELSLGAQQNSEAIRALNGTNAEFRKLGGRLSALIRYFKLDRSADRPKNETHRHGRV